MYIIINGRSCFGVGDRVGVGGGGIDGVPNTWKTQNTVKPAYYPPLDKATCL